MTTFNADSIVKSIQSAFTAKVPLAQALTSIPKLDAAQVETIMVACDKGKLFAKADGTTNTGQRDRVRRHLAVGGAALKKLIADTDKVYSDETLRKGNATNMINAIVRNMVEHGATQAAALKAALADERFREMTESEKAARTCLTALKQLDEYGKIANLDGKFLQAVSNLKSNLKSKLATE